MRWAACHRAQGIGMRWPAASTPFAGMRILHLHRVQRCVVLASAKLVTECELRGVEALGGHVQCCQGIGPLAACHCMRNNLISGIHCRVTPHCMFDTGQARVMLPGDRPSCRHCVACTDHLCHHWPLLRHCIAALLASLHHRQSLHRCTTGYDACTDHLHARHTYLPHSGDV